MKQRIFNILISLIVGMLCIIQALSYFKKEKPPKINININIANEEQPDFFSKSPQEGLMEALEYYGVKHPQIVYAQAVLETGYFKSDLCLNGNNLFGLYDSKNHRYYTFDHWCDSIVAYLNCVQYKYKPPNDYYGFLLEIGYAGDAQYIQKLKRIVNRNDKRRSK